MKTGIHKELAPYDPDWYYTRAAAIARKVYLQPGLGVGALQRKFGGAKNRGTRTFVFQKAAAGVIRHILQQLEEIAPELEILQEIMEERAPKLQEN